MAGEKKRRSVTIRLPEDLGKRLDALKKREGTTIQHAVVTALEPYLAKKGFPKKRGA